MTFLGVFAVFVGLAALFLVGCAIVVISVRSLARSFKQNNQSEDTHRNP